MKHRLVGLVVLTALGIILWPVIFDTTPVREISQGSQIPEPPRTEPFQIDEPQRPTLNPEPDYDARRRDQLEQVEGARAEEAAIPAADAAPVPKPPLDEHGLPILWGVQLGVFGQRENAQEIKTRAEAAGYHVILQVVSTGGGQQFRVYLDPKLDKTSAEQLRVAAEKKLGLPGYVTRYYP